PSRERHRRSHTGGVDRLGPAGDDQPPRDRTGRENALRRVRGIAVAAGAVALGLVLGACGSAPTTAPGSNNSSPTSAATTSSFKACMVTDTGGIDDRSFNASAWQGMQAAQSAGKAKVSYVQSKSESDYAPNIAQLVGQQCKLVVTVGGLMA